MAEVGLNHHQVVSRSLAGQRPIDEQTFASLAVLDDRLNQLKKLDRLFSSIGFSKDVKKLKGRENAVPVA